VEQKVARDTHDQTMRCETVRLPTGEEQEICPALGTLEEQARYSLFAADEAVKAAQAQLERLVGIPTQDQIDSGEANIAVATAQRDAAQAQLDILENAGPSAQQLEAAQANVDALTAQRDAAQAQLDLLLAPPADAQVSALKANVAQAQVGVQRARLALEEATLHAPFNGRVTRVDIQTGEFVGPQMPFITLVDDERFRIDVEVDEADIGRVQVGQAVQLTLDAFPDQSLTGHVAAIATQATLGTGVVSYQVTIETDATKLPLRGGMTVSADIVTDHRDDVLLVPNRAIWIDADSGQPFVERMSGEAVVGVVIEQGLTNEQFSEVVSGLSERDQLVVRSSSIRDRFREMMTRSMSGE
jgi:HlyD family secretion protein